MKLEEMIERINFLYKKSQEGILTDEEKKEQDELRKKYIENVKRNFREQLKGIKRVPPKKLQ
jgi:uncharacterized protein YnzC (UPF0291/DUF896 family)